MLIRSSLIRSFAHFAQIKWATVSDSLRSLKTNEWPWANRSGHSEVMSNHEWITQVAQDKWATMSDSLRSLRGNEWMSDLLKTFWLKKSKILFNYVLFKVFLKKFWKNVRIAHFRSFPLFFGEWCEGITHFAQIKWAIWANRSFRITKTEQPWAIRSGHSEEMSNGRKWANSQPWP